jgi:hypothetical protein
LTGMIDMSGWPDGMRVIVRKESPRPGAQLRFTDRDGSPLNLFVPILCGVNSPDWSCGTGCVPAVKIVSAPRKTVCSPGTAAASGVRLPAAITVPS